jgi:nanoRNase/pAp phosphatase (c-di-AMP/oligoRNAs hydrolase)
MSTIRKKIVPTLLTSVPTNTNAFKQSAEKKNPLDAAADLIASRYGVSDENIPQINEEAFKKNREIGKTVVPLKEYFRQSAADFEKKEIENKKVKKKREFVLPLCERKLNTLQRNIDTYIKNCDRNISDESFIAMVQKSRNKLNTSKKNSKKDGGGHKKHNNRKTMRSRSRSRSSRSRY